MYLVYSILFATACLVAVPWFLVQAVVRPKVRRGLPERLGRLPVNLRRERKPTIWVHAVSVGEVRAARSILQGLQREHPDHRLVLSVTTPTGREVAETEDLPVAGVFHLPLDLPGRVAKVLDDLDCRLFIAIETEIWPNLLRDCHRRDVPAMVLNGRISNRSFRRYRRLRFFLKRVLSHLTFAGMQTWEDAERLAWMGMPVHRMEVTGSVKFDRHPDPLPDDHPLHRWLQSDDGPLWIVASTWAGEEKAILDAARTLWREHPELRLAIAPRKPERFDEVARLLSDQGIEAIRRSHLGDAGPADGARVLLLDSLGELAGLFHHADLAFVGGSLVPVGGHNLIEPAACGTPVLFGPHVENAPQVARLLMEDGAAAQVRDAESLVREVRRLLEDEELRRAVGQRARAVVERNRGAVGASLRLVRHFLRGEGPGPRRLLPIRHDPHHGSLPTREDGDEGGS